MEVLYNENNFFVKLTDEEFRKIKPIINYDVVFENQELDFNPMVEYALKFATRMHEGQYRKNGLPYICHPIKVAEYVSRFKVSQESDMLITCAYLHDVLENTNATYYDIVNIFGSQVGSIVLELTNDDDLKKEIGKSRYMEIKMKNMSSWALVIKLCDRLDNVSDLQNSEEEFKLRYSKQTLEIIDYLIKNRFLSKTHVVIIKEIINTLLPLFYNEYDILVQNEITFENINEQKENVEKIIKKILKN